MENSTLKISDELFCDMVKLYGESHNLPPLSAKIYAYLVFDFDRKGICFDEFVQIFAASKSSVSSNIQLLLNSKLIHDFNTINERKRYFRINDNFVNIRFNEIINKMKKELVILNKLDAFRTNKDETQMKKLELYKELLNKNIANIEETLEKI